MTGLHWIEEAKVYVGFGADDEARLRAFHAVARHRYREVVDHFYAVIDRHAEARRVITEGPAQMERLKSTLRDWMDSGLAGDHDATWYEARARIGQRHVAIGLASRYMFTAVSLIRGDLTRIARELFPDDHGAYVISIDRWLDLELAIMLETYQEASEARLLERERNTQREKLFAMRRLSAGLAHEVRNPLNAAHLQLELLARRLRRAGSEDGLLAITALVDGEIRRLSGLLQEFLDFARPAQLSAVDADLVEIARQVIEVTAATAQRRGVEVVLGGDPTVPLVCDAGKVHQILHNLIGNAIDAARSRVDVELRGLPAAGELPGEVVLRIHDDGIGIPEINLAKIFEPFFSTKEHGTGMGLSITYSLVALHGGSIGVDNRGGAEFTVRLPSVPPVMDVVET